MPPHTSPQQDFKDAAAKSASPQEIQRFFAAVSANDVKGVLSFVMAYPEEAATTKSSEGLTPLMFAAREGLKETAWLLIHANGDLEIGNDNDSTALMFAAHSGKASIVAMLLEAGADVNHVNKNGHTPLMSASANGFRNTAEQLLKYNADVSSKDADGNTALDFAHENGFIEIEKMIEAAAAVQADAREKAAAEAKALAAAQNRPVTSDDNAAALKDLEKRLMRAKLAYPGADAASVKDDNADKSADEARQVLKNIQQKMDRDGPMF